MIEVDQSAGAPVRKHKFYQILYVQVLVAIVIGVLLGYFKPDLGEAMKPLGDGFIKLVKMIIAPVIFLTVTTGIAAMSDLKKSRPRGRQGDGVLSGVLDPGPDHWHGGEPYRSAGRGPAHRSGIAGPEVGGRLCD